MLVTVHGTPAPQGSKRHIGNGVLVESSAKVKPWRQDVKYAALAAAGTQPIPLDDDGLHVRIEFFLARPRGHYRTGKNSHLLRESAPERPAKKPDIDKLIRSTLDALGEAGVWSDDSRVTTVVASKHFADARPPGAVICIMVDSPRPLERSAVTHAPEEAS